MKKYGGVAELTLPNGQDVPAEGSEVPAVSPITGSVRLEFRFPKGGAGAGTNAPMAAGVGVPEAAVDEDDPPAPRHHDVRSSRQPGVVGAEPKAEGTEESADDAFGFGAGGPNGGPSGGCAFWAGVRKSAIGRVRISVAGGGDSRGVPFREDLATPVDRVDPGQGGGRLCRSVTNPE